MSEQQQKSCKNRDNPIMFDKTHQTPLKKCSPPPYQVLDLVAPYLSPETLAAAACVCKSWSVFMSSDHFWHPFCSAAYPSLSHLRRCSAVPYSKLYSIGRAAENRLCLPPPKARLALDDVVFAVDIVQSSRGLIATVVKRGGELRQDDNGGVFRFDFDLCASASEKTASFEKLDSLRVTWNVVLEGFKAVFTMMHCKGKGSFVMGLEGWFSKELPSSGCCSGGGGASGMVADLRLGLRDHGGEVVVEKVSVGVLSIVSWRYMGVDDVLRYLQHFLLN